MQKDFTRINFGWLGYENPNGNTIGTQPDMWEFVTSRAAAWDCPVSIQSNIQRFKDHPRTADNLEVMRRWEEVRVQNWLTDAQKEQLKDLEQEHILLLNEKNEFELQPYQQIENVANGSDAVRAFVFERKGDTYVVYWHTSGTSKLKLALGKSKVQLFEKFGNAKALAKSSDGTVVIPVSDRRYLKAEDVTIKQFIDIFVKAKILN